MADLEDRLDRAMTEDPIWRKHQLWARRRAAFFRRHAGKPHVRLTDRQGGKALVSRDPAKPGRWRMTRFYADGPAGHVEAPTAQEALREAWSFGYRWTA